MHDKQWYVDNHRKMWNWIADEIEGKKKCVNILKFKTKYCLRVVRLHYSDIPRSYCFACEYCDQMRFCRAGCLFNWGEGPQFVCCVDGYYDECKYAETWQEQAALARKIANLPVREDV